MDLKKKKEKKEEKKIEEAKGAQMKIVTMRGDAKQKHCELYKTDNQRLFLFCFSFWSQLGNERSVKWKVVL